MYFNPMIKRFAMSLEDADSDPSCRRSAGAKIQFTTLSVGFEVVLIRSDRLTASGMVMCTSV